VRNGGELNVLDHGRQKNSHRDNKKPSIKRHPREGQVHSLPEVESQPQSEKNP